jgi:hypothetical protein
MAQMLLFEMQIPSDARIFEALMELTSSDLFKMAFSSRTVFFPLIATKGCLSEKVFFWHSGLSQNSFLVVTKRIVCFPWIGRSWISRW